MRSVLLVFASLFAVIAPALSQTTVVVPSGAPATRATQDCIPFACSSCGRTDIRTQFVYLGSEIGSGVITEFAFRPGIAETTATGPVTFTGITIRMSTTSATPSTLDPAFALNYGADVTTVFSGNLTVSTDGSGAFDIVVPLDTPFPFNGSSGNLLIEFVVPTCPAGNIGVDYFGDYSPSGAFGVARVLSDDSSSTTSEYGRQGAGPVVQITLLADQSVPGIPALDGWAVGLLAITFSFAALFVIRARS